MLEEDAEEAIDEAWRAYADGDTVLERQWRKRAEERQLAADRAMDRLTEAEEAIGEAEYERENPEG